jgi:hypothetical protein
MMMDVAQKLLRDVHSIQHLEDDGNEGLMALGLLEETEMMHPTLRHKEAEFVSGKMSGASL